MSYFILADCNNFYVSCERLLNPKLDKKPIIILSNNDGCVVSRSQEAKDLGIKMGDVYFKIRDYCERAKVIVYSSNYALYGDISRRVMSILTSFSPEAEIYSIDEAFLKYPHMPPEDILSIALDLRKTVKRWTGIPICLGIGPTKTLAKVANDLAKKKKLYALDLSAEGIRQELFKGYEVGEVWGIGSRLAQRLNALGIYTVAQLIAEDSLLIRKKLGVIGERLQYELQGIACSDLEKATVKKSITRSRCFGRSLSEETEIAEALASFAADGCVALREQKSCARAITVFLEITPEKGEQFQRLQLSQHALLDMPTNDTSAIIKAAKECLKNIYRPHLRYRKCGIIFLDLLHEEDRIPDLFIPVNPKRKILMETMDEINNTFGKESLFLASMGVHPVWKGKKQFHSHYNTTDWGQLPTASAL